MTQPAPLVHLTARALPGTLLFHDWTEALELWRRLLRAFPDARALCLMPNHPHVVAPDDRARQRLSAVMSGYARWRAHHRKQDGACWQPQPRAEPIPDAAHQRRTVRYVLLNPCRGNLVEDPLAWPLSLHRDLVGLGDPARRAREPEALHRYVSSDPTVSITGTELPGLYAGPARLDAIETAVGAVLRLQPGDLLNHAHARTLLVRAAWYRENTDMPALADHLGLARSGAYRLLGAAPARAAIREDPWLSAVLRVTGDPRFPALTPRRGGARWSEWRL
jgi:hypothetical protein